jgi:hypothetical protein
MSTEVTISAGNVLTVALLKKIDKSAYQFGGFKTLGGVSKKTSLNLDAKTNVLIPARFIKCDVNKFIEDFSKTMNSWYYEIIIK